MDVHACLSVIEGTAYIKYYNHEQLNTEFHSRKALTGSHGIGNYVIYRYSSHGRPINYDRACRIGMVKTLRGQINNQCMWSSDDNGYTSYRFVVARYADSDFTQQIDITLDDPIFGAHMLNFSNELREQLDAYNAEI